MIVNTLSEANFTKIHADLEFIMACFQEVLEELGEHELAHRLPWRNSTPPFDYISQPHRTAQAYSIAFQLLNMVEENASVQMRRVIEAEGGLTEVPGLWQQNLQRLTALGLTGEQIAANLARIRVEPVLTAHPTEAKRATVLEHHRRLYLLLVKRENQIWTPSEREEIREAVKVELERLWRTGEIYLEKPNVASERHNIIYYLHNVFPHVLPELDRRLRYAWQSMGFDPALLASPTQLPRLTFGNWVGGDRDGHPLVTATVTAQTLADLRQTALQLLKQQLTDLAGRISLSERLQTPPRSLLERIDELAHALGESGRQAVLRSPQEPWRQIVNLIIAKLPIIETEAAIAQNRYRSAAELMADLMDLRQNLLDVKASRIAYMDVDPIIRMVQTFGFHLAALDIRQNSRFHDLAVAQLMLAAGLDGADFPHWPEARRVEFLKRELLSPRLLPGPICPWGPKPRRF
jgi:phosphoenolpyruvate carboxylase